jgi:invasion protein IalB
MIKKYLTFSFISLISAMGFASQANSQEFLGEHKAWGVFSINQNGEKVCYITSTPTKKKGNYNKRGEPYMLVTYRSNGVSEVSVNSGYPFKNNSEVTVRVDSRHTYNFFTSSETPEMAWAKDSKTDQEIISKMKAGNRLTSKGYSKLGTYSEDTYSLAGFTAAFNQMSKSCQ